MNTFLQAILFQAGYNVALVTVGAILLGIAAGSAGTFLFLRKRALVSDAIAHATLPGVGIAFIIMIWLGGDGRSILGLLCGSTITAFIGLIIIEWIPRRTRLAEDAAIGSVLGVFFGAGIVLLTVIQTMSSGRQAGLESFLLGSTAGMLFQDAVVIAIGGFLSILGIWIARRPLTIVAFDQEYATSLGYDVQKIDLLMMGLVLGVTVIGMKLVGLILIVAMLIIPAVTARFWSNRTNEVVMIAGFLGGLSGYIGATLSASAPSLPTGPIIVLFAILLFVLSLFLSPKRGVFSIFIQHQKTKTNIHRRQGLLTIAKDKNVISSFTQKLLVNEGLLGLDGMTNKGKKLVTEILIDENRWTAAEEIFPDKDINKNYGIKFIEEILTKEELTKLDQYIKSQKFKSATYDF